MSKRAEEAALKAYPYDYPEREGYKKGYEQAEKDLADVAVFSSGPDGFYYGKGYQQGKKDAENHLGWHPASEHPEVDEEVIVLVDNIPIYLTQSMNRLDAFPIYKIAFGHIVNIEYCKDYDGWNIPGVKYWMLMPKLEE